jgi:tetratricopeptide (TPR) repeat protein
MKRLLALIPIAGMLAVSSASMGDDHNGKQRQASAAQMPRISSFTTNPGPKGSSRYDIRMAIQGRRNIVAVRIFAATGGPQPLTTEQRAGIIAQRLQLISKMPDWFNHLATGKAKDLAGHEMDTVITQKPYRGSNGKMTNLVMTADKTSCRIAGVKTTEDLAQAIVWEIQKACQPLPDNKTAGILELSAKAYFDLGLDIVEGRNPNYAEAIKDFKQAIIRNPDYVEAYIQQAKIEPQLADALQLLAEALKHDPGAEQREAMAQWLAHALQKNPDQIEAIKPLQDQLK